MTSASAKGGAPTKVRSKVHRRERQGKEHEEDPSDKRPVLLQPPPRLSGSGNRVRMDQALHFGAHNVSAGSVADKAQRPAAVLTPARGGRHTAPIKRCPIRNQRPGVFEPPTSLLGFAQDAAYPNPVVVRNEVYR